MNPAAQAMHDLKGHRLPWLRLRFPLVCRWANLVALSWAQLRSGWTSAAELLGLQLLICCKRISQTQRTAKRQTTHTVLVYIPPLACLPSSPKPRCLPSSDYSHSFSPVINPSTASCFPALWMLLSFLAASRFSASFQAGFKQLCETSKFLSLCGLFGKADNDIASPADLQQIALLHQPSTVILHLWLCRGNQQLPLFS